MDIETELDMQHKLRQIAYDGDVAQNCLDFFKTFPENEAWFISELNELYWRNRHAGAYRNHISKTAIPLAKKIYEQLGIVVFPFIQRVACRGWDTAGGTWAWSMNTPTSDIGSGDPVAYLLRKKVKLYASEGERWSQGEIGGQES